jgi:hypothetical protein
MPLIQSLERHLIFIRLPGRGNDLVPMRIEKIVGIEARKFRARRHPPSAIGPPSFLKVLRRERLFSTGVLVPTLGGEAKSMASTEDTLLIRQAMAYVIELYREMTDENSAPTLGTQNQVVDSILAEPELRRAVSDWARTVEIDEATTEAKIRLPHDNTYRRISACLQSAMEPSVFFRQGQSPR